MAYNPPSQNSIPFNFTTGGYQAPDFGQIALNFSTKTAATAALGAAITGVYANYQEETYTYLKYCDRYVVGYSRYGIQIMKGKCYYGGIRDLGATIIAESKYRDLGAYINPQGFGYDDLGGYIKVLQPGQADLPASITTAEQRDLGAIIGAHPPIDLGAIIGGHLPSDLPGYIMGWDYKDLQGIIGGLKDEGLPAEIYPVPPVDLPAYLKVWPQEDLPGDIHGWQTKDLQAYLNALDYRDLLATIAGHPPRNLGALLKGWVREAEYDLAGSLYGYDKGDLPGIINPVFKEDLPGSIFPIPPANLPAIIRGWQEADLPASINVQPWPWDLPASVTGYPPVDLPATIIAKGWPLPYDTDLSAYIHTLRTPVDIAAYVNVKQFRDLSAFVDTGRDIKDLTAYIRPKMIRLTGVLSVVTMEHSDLTATISIPCFYSDLKDLSGYIRPMYLASLAATIYPKGWVKGIENLNAKWGYATDYIVVDKLPITVNITELGFRTEDRQPIYLTVFKTASFLSAYIYGEYQTRDVAASITGLALSPYDFENYKNRERVYELAYQVAYDWQDVTIEFSNIVSDYYYGSTGEFAAKRFKNDEWWVTKFTGWFSPDTAARLNRKIHKVRKLYGMNRFANVDEAVKYYIDLVTTWPSEDMAAYINGTGAYKHLAAIVNGITTVSTYEGLSSSINGTLTHPYDVVIAYTEDGVGYLQFS